VLDSGAVSRLAERTTLTSDPADLSALASYAKNVGVEKI
jgi:hypothetical protein